jgi:hypothetical protein
VRGGLSGLALLVVYGPVIIQITQRSTLQATTRLVCSNAMCIIYYLFRSVAPELLTTIYGMEINFIRRQILPESELTGRFKRDERPADVWRDAEVADARKKQRANAISSNGSSR